MKEQKEKTQKLGFFQEALLTIVRLKNFFPIVLILKWRNRWTQYEIAFNCPITPLKKAIRQNWFHF